MIQKGFFVYCSWCSNRELFTSTKTLKDVEKLLKKWGWVKFEKNHFCDKDCREYYLKEEENVQLRKPVKQ